MTDNISPKLTSVTPDNNEINVSTSKNIVFTFDETIQIGNGYITLTDGEDIRKIATSDTSQIILSDNELRIDLTDKLLNYRNYIVQFDKNAVQDLAGNSFSSSGSYGFTTKAVDSYLKNATIFADQNANGIWDDGEVNGTTDENGDFSLAKSRGSFIATSGIDLTSNLEFSGTLKAPAGSEVITPLTTVLLGFKETGLSSKDAQKATAKAFNFDKNIDLKTYEPLASLKNATDLKEAADLMATSTKIANFLATGGLFLSGAAGRDALTGDDNLSSQDASNVLLKSLISAIQNTDNGQIDLTDSTLLRSVLIESAKEANSDTANFTAAEAEEYRAKVALMADSVADILKNSAEEIDDGVSIGGDAPTLLENIGEISAYTQNVAGNILKETAASLDINSTTVESNLDNLSSTLYKAKTSSDSGNSNNSNIVKAAIDAMKAIPISERVIPTTYEEIVNHNWGILTKYDPTQTNEPALALISSLSLTDTNSITATPISGEWKNPFGLKGASVSSITAGITPSLTPILTADFTLDKNSIELKDGSILLDLGNSTAEIVARLKAFDLPTLPSATLTVNTLDSFTLNSDIDIESWTVKGDITVNPISNSFSQTGNLIFGTKDPVANFFTNTLGIASIGELLMVSNDLVKLDGGISGNLTLVDSGGFKASMAGASFQWLTVKQTLPLPPKVTTGLFGDATLKGYDPTQSGEPDLDLTAGVLFSPDSFGLSGSLDTGGRWKNPFGFTGMQIGEIAIDVGAFLTTPPTPEHFGFVADAKLNGIDLTGLFYASLNPLSPNLAFALTVNKEVGLLEMMVASQVGLAGAVPGATHIISSFTDLLNPFDPQVISIDGDGDGGLDPLIQFMPTAVVIADKAYGSGYAINAEVSIGGATGTLSFKANTDFNDISGSLKIHNLHFGDWLVISGANGQKDLTVNFGLSIIEPTIYFDASAALSLFGYDLAQADITVTPTSIKVENSYINFIPGILSLDVDELYVDILKLSASGEAELSIFGQDAVTTEFDFSPNSLSFAAVVDLAGIFGIDAAFELDTKTGSFHAEGDLSFFGSKLSSATVDYTTNDGLILTGDLRVKVDNIGTVKASLKVETKDVDNFTISVEADVPRLGSLSFSVKDNDVNANFIGKYIENQFLSLGDKVEWVADELRDTTDDFGKVSESLLNNAGKEITSGIKDATGNLVAGASSAGKSIKKLFGGGSNKNKSKYSDESITFIGTEHGENDGPVKGSTKDDVMFGNGGHDKLWGGTGNDSLDGGTSNDSLNGGVNDDMLNGGDGNDQLLGEDGLDSIYGGAGNDLIIGSATKNDPTGDYMDGGEGNDNIQSRNPSTGEDSIYGGDGNDLIRSYGGDDYINGGAGNDTIDGGDGTDTIDYSFYNQAAIILTLQSDTSKTTIVSSTSGTDSLLSIENVTGSMYADMITGNSLNNVLKGGDGNDTLDGGAGNDLLEGGEGNDNLYSGSTGNNTLNGGEGDDILLGNSYYDLLIGGLGNDSLNGGTRDDTLVGGSGNDTLDGGDYNDSLDGGEGDDVLLGGRFYDLLQGGAGNDSLDGGTYNDTLDGGDGNDILTGGSEADTFRFTLDSDLTTVSYDVITDFAHNTDRIDLSSIDANTAISGDQAFTLITGSVFTAAGQLRFDSETNVLYGNIDSDEDAEFSVLLTGSVSVTASDFTL